MMDIRIVSRPGLPALYSRECPEHPEETQVCSLKQAKEHNEAEHNEAMHPRRWRRLQRREEILAELQPAMRELIVVEDTPAVDAWGQALPFKVPELERGRLRDEGLLT